MSVVEFSRILSADLPLSVRPLGLVFLLRGSIHVRARDLSLRIRPGELFVVRQEGQVELVVTRDGAEGILFRAGLDWLDRILEVSGLGPRAQGAPLCIERAGSDLAERARRLMVEGLLRSGEADQPNAVVHAARALELASIAIGSRAGFDPALGAGRGGSRRARFVRALEEVRRESLEDISLDDFARRLGVSARQTSRLFKRDLGMSFPAYLQSVRIERAKELLESHGLSVTQVGLATGWQSLSHFNAVFRRRVGTTPSGFRALALTHGPERARA